MAIFSLQKLVIEFISQNEKDVQYHVWPAADRSVCCLPAGRWPGPGSQTPPPVPSQGLWPQLPVVATTWAGAFWACDTFLLTDPDLLERDCDVKGGEKGLFFSVVRG